MLQEAKRSRDLVPDTPHLEAVQQEDEEPINVNDIDFVDDGDEGFISGYGKFGYTSFI